MLPRAAAVTLLLATTPQIQAAAQPEQVIVTAQRREEPLSQSPLAISVIDGAALYSGHIQSPADLASQLVNVEVAQPFGNVFPAFVVRGIGLNDYNVNNNPTVGIYRDDVYLSSNAMIPKVLFDLRHDDQRTRADRHGRDGVCQRHEAPVDGPQHRPPPRSRDVWSAEFAGEMDHSTCRSIR